MGEVFLASMRSNLGVSKPCIIKRILPQLLNNDLTTTRFVDEMRMLAKLHHTNIVNAFEFGDVNGRHYVAMEYVDGLSLDDLLVALRLLGKPLPLPLSLYVLLHVSRGLNYLHDAKVNGNMAIVHRDLCPQNILISKQGEIKITDFGLAKSNINTTQSTDGSIKGHLHYMAPEQAKGQTVGPQADLFSFATVAYELIVGERFFNFGNQSVAEALRTIVMFDPAKHPVATADLSEELKQFLLTLLDTEPSRRRYTADKVTEFISEQLAGERLDQLESLLVDLVRAAVTTKPVIAAIPVAATLSVKPEALKPAPIKTAPTNSEVAFAPLSHEFVPIAPTPGLKKIKRRRSWGLPRLPSMRTVVLYLLFAFVLAVLVVIAIEENWLPEQATNQASEAVGKMVQETKSAIKSVPALQADETGALYVDTNPRGASVFVNGAVYGGLTPYVVENLAADKRHILKLELPGYKPYHETFTLKADEKKIIVVSLEKK